MPDPRANFQAFAASLEQSGFDVVARSAPWRPDYVAHVNEGTAGNLNIIGWTGDYGDPDNFIGTFFQGPSPQFGLNLQGQHATITALLNRAEREVNLARRIALYKRANRLIMEFLPGVPYAHSRPALAAQRRVRNYVASPIGTDPFAPVFFAGGQ